MIQKDANMIKEKGEATLSNRHISSAVVQGVLKAVKAGPNAVAMQAKVSAAALRAAHSGFSSSSWTVDIKTGSCEVLIPPGTCMGGNGLRKAERGDT